MSPAAERAAQAASASLVVALARLERERSAIAGARFADWEWTAFRALSDALADAERLAAEVDALLREARAGSEEPERGER